MGSIVTEPSVIWPLRQSGTYFTKGLGADQRNLSKNLLDLTCILMIQSGHDFAHIMAVHLSWHVQHSDRIIFVVVVVVCLFVVFFSSKSNIIAGEIWIMVSQAFSVMGPSCLNLVKFASWVGFTKSPQIGLKISSIATSNMSNHCSQSMC